MSDAASIADALREQIPTSTDPARLERMARSIEGTTGPRRIQRKRLKGWRMPPLAIYVGRSGNGPGKWGNRYAESHIGAGAIIDGSMVTLPKTPTNLVRWFRQDIEDRLQRDPDYLEPLRGRDLACWCALDAPCHADVLLELANRPRP